MELCQNYTCHVNGHTGISLGHVLDVGSKFKVMNAYGSKSYHR